ncbi:methyltransferase domain-containing protein [Nocardia mexicana]|uniref:Demethylmenaquinone methyltransferase/2-methoxy-6-polyprenyl-1,4-benzoquinol methylase n=1 Tax=Nocardia mexicana TaxID=279262 RepID=A0A370GUQ1_9NOCA|nr:methyltransferase domain-containing protein [Nocardia mexicana]RDI46284.1 demethylmenaquinone methyltransferase/2-methoxy-6-polyprenyl-1,4-benzoquinol methylase [Nocardia mexicana]
MFRNVQVFPVTVPDEAGLLITSPRRYNALNAVLFGGRHAGLVAELAAASGALPGDHVLDIGSGPGKLARALAAKVGPEGGVLGVDASGPMVEFARAHARQPNCRFEVGVAQSLPVGDAELDVVTCTFVMHHVAADRREAALAEMWRVLRPGGRLLLADAHPNGLMRAVVGVMGRVSRRHSHSPAEHGQGHHGVENPAVQRDPLAEVDVRRYAETLRTVGFEPPSFTVSRYATGILTTRKPR